MKEKEENDKIVAERNNEINTLNNKIEYDKLTYHFNDFNSPLALMREIKDGSIDLEKAKQNQEKIRSNVSETTREKWEHKSKVQKITINNLKDHL